MAKQTPREQPQAKRETIRKTARDSGNGNSGSNNPNSGSNGNNASQVGSRRSASPAFQAKLTQMARRLSPFVQVNTGHPHPSFPKTLLAFWLLTEVELDSMALFFHQADGSWLRGEYPCPVPWSHESSLETKRRRFGRFIGIRGCESPTCEGGQRDSFWLKTEEEIMAELRRERIEEEERMRKTPFRR
jgi:hypothetical protein